MIVNIYKNYIENGRTCNFRVLNLTVKCNMHKIRKDDRSWLKTKD